jgi:hypothetical protein
MVGDSKKDPPAKPDLQGTKPAPQPGRQQQTPPSVDPKAVATPRRLQESKESSEKRRLE